MPRVRSRCNEFSSSRNASSITHGSDWVRYICTCKYFTQCWNLTAWKQETSSRGRVHWGRCMKCLGESVESTLKPAWSQLVAAWSRCWNQIPLLSHKRWLRFSRPHPQDFVVLQGDGGRMNCKRGGLLSLRHWFLRRRDLLWEPHQRSEEAQLGEGMRPHGCLANGLWDLQMDSLLYRGKSRRLASIGYRRGKWAFYCS